MKLKLDPDEVCEILETANIIQIKGFTVKDINWNRTYDNFEVLLEKSPVDQGINNSAKNKLERRPTPTPSTPPIAGGTFSIDDDPI